jgi:hypothetical protein
MLLEWLWGMGGDLRIWPDYTLEDRDGTRMHLFRAMWLFREMHKTKVVPANSTLEAIHFGEEYGSEKEEETGVSWLFARHWHSTLVDVLTAKREGKGKGKNGFAWEPNKTRLEVAPIPVALSKYMTNPGLKPEDFHASCWGEWYLAFLRGSENEALAVNLINNLMTSRRVRDRAFSCAGLPTVDKFYETYGNIRCFNIPERPDIELPAITFNGVRKRFFRARTRIQIFDYRHCMPGFHSMLEQLHDFPDTTDDELTKLIDDAIRKTEKLGDKVRFG